MKNIGTIFYKKKCILLIFGSEPLTLTNIFALVEIKFQGDRIDEKQFKAYDDLRKQCAALKRASHITASEGFKLSLFRYPEDASPTDAKDSQSSKPNRQRRTR